MMEHLGSITAMDGPLWSFLLQATGGTELNDGFVLTTTMASTIVILSMVYEYSAGLTLAHVCCYFPIWQRQLSILEYICILKGKFAQFISYILSWRSRI